MSLAPQVKERLWINRSVHVQRKKRESYSVASLIVERWMWWFGAKDLVAERWHLTNTVSRVISCASFSCRLLQRSRFKALMLRGQEVSLWAHESTADQANTLRFRTGWSAARPGHCNMRNLDRL